MSSTDQHTSPFKAAERRQRSAECRWLIAAVSVAFLTLVVSLADAADDPTIPVAYNHRSTNTAVTFHVALKPNQPFQVTILDTCEAQFDYALHGVPTAPADTAGLRAPPVPRLTTKVLTTRYDPQYGSYLLDITEKTGGSRCFEWRDTKGIPVEPPAAALNDSTHESQAGRWHEVELNPVQLVIAVTAIEWEIGQDAALAITPFAIRKWKTEPPPQTFNQVATNQYRVVRHSDAEDIARFNFATLTHLYFPGRNHGPAMGLGVVDNTFEYYFGWSRGLGPRNNRVVNFATGVVITPVATLPPNVTEDGPLSQGTIEGEFGNALKARWFVAITATFFRSRGDSNQKPAAPVP